MVTWLLLACATSPQPIDPIDEAPAAEAEAEADPGEAPPAAGPSAPSNPVAALSRASLDLRGVRPSLDELALIQADPAAYDALVEGFLTDPRFGERIREMWGDLYLTHVDYYYVSASEYGIGNSVGFIRAVGDEPLRILSTIAEEDLPYTELVVGDWTVMNELNGRAFYTDYPDDATGWQKVHYTDGRPAAGVLSTNGMWWRYTSTDSNANRGRANAISRILVCNDYLARPIEFDRNVNLLDADALADALQNNPGCVNCHATLDPIASYLYGFYHYLYDAKEEITGYHPEREGMWSSATGVAPAWMGEPGYSLADLGEQIAADPRLPSCFVEQVHERILGRSAEISDMNSLTAHREAFLASGLTVRSVFRSVLAQPEYREGLRPDGSLARRMMSPDQLARVLEDLTGFRFYTDGYDLLQSDTYGVRTLAGGVDGVYATRPATEPNATMLLVHERLAQAAADYVVGHDKSADATRDRLFTRIAFTETPDRDRETMALQIQDLHLRLFGAAVTAEGPEVEANLALWTELYALSGDPAEAWQGLLTVLLRDPDLLVY
jgi:hypothetical protein